MSQSPALPLSVTIITLNEEKNLRRAIESVRWASEILVVDSGSTDRTCEIASEMGARVLKNPWPGYGKQKNFAQDHARYDWILNIDADECVPPQLRARIETAFTQVVQDGKSPIKAFRFPRKTYYLGRWIEHGGWYPNYLIRLADRRFARWTEPNVHEELNIQGEVITLDEPLHHFTFSCIQDQIVTNLRFSRLGFMELKRQGRAASISLLLLKPIGKFLETYVLKRGFLDGLPGLIISINAAHSMFLKYAYLIEDKIHYANPDHRQ